MEGKSLRSIANSSTGIFGNGWLSICIAIIACVDIINPTTIIIRINSICIVFAPVSVVIALTNTESAIITVKNIAISPSMNPICGICINKDVNSSPADIISAVCTTATNESLYFPLFAIMFTSKL